MDNEALTGSHTAAGIRAALKENATRKQNTSSKTMEN
jgi:hypothetical protein